MARIIYVSRGKVGDGPLYFAYGSNMHHAHRVERVAAVRDLAGMNEHNFPEEHARAIASRAGL